jgi:hypothetical protein
LHESAPRIAPKSLLGEGVSYALNSGQSY